MKYINLILLFLCGCQAQKIDKKEDRKLPLELPKHFLIPTEPPNFLPAFDDAYNIQINPVPHPFRITEKYVVWVNKRKVRLNREQINLLISYFDLPQEKPIDTADIHSGAGWQHPFNLND